MLREALVNPSVDAVMWRITEPAQHLSSLPVDELDVLVLPDDGAGYIASFDQFESNFSLLMKSSNSVWKIGSKAQSPDSMMVHDLSPALVQHVLNSISN